MKPTSPLVVSALVSAVYAVSGCKFDNVVSKGFNADFYKYPLFNLYANDHPEFFVSGYQDFGGYFASQSGITDLHFDGGKDDWNVVQRGSIYGVDISASNFAVALTGYFLAEETGDYTFEFSADDGFGVFIGSTGPCCENVNDTVTEVAQFSGTKAGNLTFVQGVVVTKSITVSMEADTYYPIKIVYVNELTQWKLFTTVTSPSGKKATDFSNVFQVSSSDRSCPAVTPPVPVSSDVPVTSEVPSSSVDIPVTSDVPSSSVETCTTITVTIPTNSIFTTPGTYTPTDCGHVPTCTVDVVTPDVPTPDVPVSSDVPVTSEVPCSSDVPVTPEVPSSSVVTVSSDVPVTPEVPSSSVVPVSSDVPVTPEVPSSSVVTVSSDVPVIPEVPSSSVVVPATSDVPVTPEVPSSSVVVPATSDVPVTPEVPSSSVVPSSGVDTHTTTTVTIPTNSIFTTPGTYTPTDCDSVPTCTVDVVTPDVPAETHGAPPVVTVTDKHETTITVTSCSDHQCSTKEGIVSVVTTTIHDRETTYTTICPLTDDSPATPAQPHTGEETPAVPAQPNNGEETPAVPAQPNNGEETPAVPAQPNNAEETPAVPAQPNNGDNTPATPAQPNNGEETPVVPAQPNNGDQTPVTPAQPNNGEETPAVPAQPNNGEETPAVPSQPNNSEETPAVPAQPNNGDNTPATPAQPNSGEETPAAPAQPNNGENTPAENPSTVDAESAAPGAGGDTNVTRTSLVPGAAKTETPEVAESSSSAAQPLSIASFSEGSGSKTTFSIAGLAIAFAYFI